MKTICIAVSILSFFCSTSIAQAPTVMMKPAKYDEKPDGDLVDGKATKSTKLWMAFSDRDNNSAYESPSELTPVVRTAGYMDKFYVTGELGDFLELYKWKDETGTRITAVKGTTQLNLDKAERVGWIKKQNLLLWSKCLVNKQTGFSEKALAVVTRKNLDKELRADNSVKIYTSPIGDKENDNIVDMSGFLYVYKKSGSRVLIGKTSRTQQYNAEKDILGWVDSICLQFWLGRLCLDVNHDPMAVNARKLANVKASLFYSKDEALAWKEGKLTQPIWDKDSYEQVLKPSQLRFPVFDRVEIDGAVLIKTGLITRMVIEDTSDFIHSIQVNPVVENYLYRLGAPLADSDLATKVNSRNPQFFVPAWTVENVDQLQHNQPVFEYILYLNEDELVDLMAHLFKLTAGDVPPTDLRNTLYNTYESLSQTYFDKEIANDKKFKKTITLAQIIERITGLRSKSPQIEDVKCTDIKDRNKVSDATIEEIVIKMRNSYEALRKAKNDIKGEIRYPTDNGTFYWIPQDYLP